MTTVPSRQPAGGEPLRRITLAADLGGTHVRAALVEATGAILVHQSVETPHHGLLPTTLVDLMTGVVHGHHAEAVIVGVPGPVDYRAGALTWAPHIPGSWVRELTEEWLGERLGHTVTLANDADLAAVGEAYFGAGRAYDDVVYLTVSTGIGAGVVLGRRLVHGNRSIGEIGHTVIDRTAWREGRPATLEGLGSGSSIARLSAESGLGPLDGPQLEEELAGGGRRARQIWDGVVDAVTIGVLNAGLLFGPQAVVVGGGLGSRDRLISAVRENLDALPGPVPFVLLSAELGDDVGLVGASAWARAFGPRTSRSS